MKTLLTIFSFLFVTSTTSLLAQDYDDLKILYADGNYPKLVSVGTKYTENDKTKKDIMPYIWVAKGYYKLWLSGTSDEEFKNAFKDGINFLGKAIKYDLKYNEGTTIAEEKEFVDEFQLSLYEMIENELSAKSYKKAYSWAIKYQKITTQEVGIKFVMGACKHFDQDKPTARTLWQEAQKLMAEIESLDDWSEADRNMLKVGILHSAVAMKESRQEDSARDLLGKAAQWFEDDEDWKEKYDEIVN